jgi:hypothetical protein
MYLLKFYFELLLVHIRSRKVRSQLLKRKDGLQEYSVASVLSGSKMPDLLNKLLATVDSSSLHTHIMTTSRTFLFSCRLGLGGKWLHRIQLVDALPHLDLSGSPQLT